MPWTLGLLLLLQDVDAPSARHELRVYLFEELDEENEHEHYEQAGPLELPFLTRGAAGRVEQRVSLHTACRWKTREPAPAGAFAFPWLPDGAPSPQDGAPWEGPSRPVPTFTPVDTTSRPTDTIPLSLTLRIHDFNPQIRSGSAFRLDPLTTTGTQIGTPGSPGGGGPATQIPPATPPPPPPPITKSILGGSGSGEDASASPYLAGPELSVPLASDASGWDALRWLPSGSSLSLYGHVLFGEMEAEGVPFDVVLYGVGPRLGIPLLSGALSADLRVSAGPAFLSTDVGDAAGADLAAGAGARLLLVGNLSLVASAEYRGFFAPDVSARGPSFNVGVDWGW